MNTMLNSCNLSSPPISYTGPPEGAEEEVLVMGSKDAGGEGAVESAADQYFARV